MGAAWRGTGIVAKDEYLLLDLIDTGMKVL
jgi:hypothetical protein